MKTKRFLAWCLVLTMIMTLMPGMAIGVSAEPAVIESSTKENANQAGGIIYTKTSTAKSDGTVDITLTAHTTGEVRQMSSVTPTDIVLVLDTSGSMSDSYTTTTINGYNAIMGRQYTYTTGFWLWEEEHTAYGFNSSTSYYVNIGTSGEPVYRSVTRTGRDANGFEMYEYTAGTNEVIVYPALNITPSAERANNYPVVQFYTADITRTTVNKMTELKSAVKSFIDTTEQMNEGLDAKDMHNISIVRFASNASVVSELTAVDASGAATLKNAVDGLSANGATAVDYGLEAAEEILMNRSQVVDESAVDRNEVIIVFADGEPNHQNGFSTTVANDSIAIAGAMKKEAGVKIYTVCIAEGADANDETSDINKFMHYVSSNYPDATSMSLPGSRASSSDYYKTIDNDHSLSVLFESIIQEIDHPTITMGTDATMVDTISPYFDFVGTASNVKLQTSLRNADGTWAAPVNDSTLKCSITEDRLVVDGFDFDENFISSTGRGENGDFYGKQLVISFTVTPDYAVIDAASATLMDGILPTNSGLASLNDSDSTPAAEVETPVLNTHQVVYKVDGAEVKSYNRFVGSEIAVDAVPQKEGYTFSGWTVSGLTAGNGSIAPGNTFTMPPNDVEITGTFTANPHKVTYIFSGELPTPPAGKTLDDYLPKPNGGGQSFSVDYGTKYVLAPIIETGTGTDFPGYTFVGWTPRQEAVKLDYNETSGEYSFTMPDYNVTLIGEFEKGQNTAYTLRHHLETFTDGVYEIGDVEHRTGETQETVLVSQKYFEGFTLDADKTRDATDNDETFKLVGNVANIEATILPDGSRVFDFYYTRNKHKVYYEIDGVVPEGVIIPATSELPYGKAYTVESALSAPGYTFTGWYLASDTTHSNISDTSRIMPDSDVYISGHFTARNDTVYTVKHFLQNANDDGYTEQESRRQTLTGTTGSRVSAGALNLGEWDFNEEETSRAALSAGQTYANKTITATVSGEGDTVISFYYTRKTYNIHYRFEGLVPDSMIGQEPVDSTEYRYGKNVPVDSTVKSLPVPDGFTEFKGWYLGSVNETNLIDTETIEMPAHDIYLIGYFVPSENTAYTVKHFLQNANDDNYAEASEYTEVLYGRTGVDVTAYPLTEIEELGFVYNATLSEPTKAVDASGLTVLELYYDRINKYSVEYKFEGDIPASMVGHEPTDSSNYRYEQNVDYKAAPVSIPGYDFSGWHIHDSDIITTSTGFEMPARNVVVYGRFTAKTDVNYTVNHFLEYFDAVSGTTKYGDENGAEGVAAKTETFTATTDTSVTANPIPFIGYTFNSSISHVTDTVNGDGSTELNLYYDRIPVNVTYIIEGVIPSGAAPVPNGGAAIGYHYKDIVDLDTTVASITGYKFTGWKCSDPSVVITANKFEMPAHNLIFTGHFHAETDILYRIKHFQQEIDGSYPSVPHEEEVVTGTADAQIKVYAKKYTGFTVDAVKTGDMADAGENVTDERLTGGDYVYIESTISPDGSRSIDFYYNRNAHKITYEYEGITPDGTPTKPVDEENVPFGKDIIVASAPLVPGYTFTGWYDGADTNIVTSFTMPDKDVVLKGKFASNLVDYQVKYWFQNLDAGDTFDADDYTLDTANSYTRQAYVGEHVEADSKNHTGFSVNTNSNTFGHVTVNPDGTGSLILNIYYDRHTYNVAYGYYGEQPAGVPDLTANNLTSIRYGAEITVAPKPTHSGYVFDGWYTRTATVNDNKFTMPNHDVAFLGRFSKEHTVSYNLNGGTGAAGVDYSTETVVAGSNVTVKEAPTRASYTFTGWTSELGANLSGDSVTVNQDLTFVAQWTYSGGGSYPGGGGGVTKYTLTYESNGGTEYNKETYNRNTTVAINKKPVKEGYVLEGWYEDKELTKYVEEVKMTKNITVYAKWVEDNGGAGNGYDTPGSLNGEDHFAYVVGYPDGTVRPNDHITRAEVTAIFFRLLKPDELRDKNLTDENTFDDVNSTDWHNTSISTMAKLGIVKGRYADHFMPDLDITRAEFATICARFDDSEYEIVDNFTDVKGHWAEADIHEAAAHGWIRGYEDGTFKPDQFITRAEAMTMINRVLNRIPEKAEDLLSDMIVWPDNSDKSEWYYLAVQEATNSHDYEMKNHIYEKWTALRKGTDWLKY